MQVIDSARFDQLLKEVAIKPRFKRNLKYHLSVEGMDEQAWSEKELLPVWNKSRSGGIVLLQPADKLYLLPFESGEAAHDSTGRVKAAICDFCYTWQSSGGVGLVTFYPDTTSPGSVAYLCCKDLRCSDHVRTKTAVGLKSRTQIRENLDNEGRVLRLNARIREVAERLGLAPVN